MPDKPTTAAGYKSERVDLVRATCLYVATELGDIMDELVVIGGLVPSLLIKQEELPEGADAHVGTMDLDVGLTPNVGALMRAARASRCSLAAVFPATWRWLP
jgi:hypothetical protein